LHFKLSYSLERTTTKTTPQVCKSEQLLQSVPRSTFALSNDADRNGNINGERDVDSGLRWNNFSPPYSIFGVAMETYSLLGFWSRGPNHQGDGRGNHLLCRALGRVSLL